ncbi:MAG: 3'-5' exonuclease [Acinetobacter sp.]|nr:3'-5' exonuclease [Acinetobacter sp.]
MLSWIKNTFATQKAAYQKSRLLRPEFAAIFDQLPDEWVSLDLEMTGLNPKSDHILSVGAVRIRKDHNKQGNAFVIATDEPLNIICKPPIMPTTENIIVHGLRPMDLQGGMSYDAMLEQLLPFIAGRTLVGFCVDMDVKFLNTLVKPFLGFNLPNDVLDVSRLDQHLRLNKVIPDVLPELRHLNTLLDEYQIPRLPAHDAYHDALMCAMLFCHLQAKAANH